ncbi:hypothetical protein RHGRI_007529 [Rhododendron griersonianum]|uniref:beta-N-acetylhexosaminidase n=1 Tax=Rhododendron griersonianum TaxID=479676 RepID=A0AAV6KYK4_9ERIC|nr:hypothetical protein RHGRI_007529 [Rhododendron griersonianum]KAG5557299.1 hypothetical protein RHGRI_007529 [Rhododendron griersonianum]KAG5557300.1 hypothetical protein RHGRI_007529 [Rhododendron griersonianum]KAG5557301.1 hypothetical protein RHGRI_007529 [Rhododendron griersonianum]
MAADSATPNPSHLLICIYTVFVCISVSAVVHAQTLSLGSKHNSTSQLKDSLVYLWPLPAEYTFGNGTLSVDPDLSLAVGGNGGNSAIVRDAFERYRAIIFKHGPSNFRPMKSHISKVRVVVHSDNEELQLGTDESYSLIVAESDDRSIIAEATIEANSVYGALRGLETFSQLCTYDYETKSIHIYKAPWYVRDRPRFAFRGLLLDTSRHYYPVDVIKQIIESMSYAKLNVLHWHIIDEESFPLEVPTYPKLWKGAYSKWERYTIEDADEIVK